MKFDNLPIPLQSLLTGKVPDVEWPLTPTIRLAQSWRTAVDQWRYLPEKFMLASRNIYCRVPMLPLLAYLTLTLGRVPSLSAMINVISFSPAKCFAVDARAYQCHTGFLRELHVGLALAE